MKEFFSIKSSNKINIFSIIGLLILIYSVFNSYAGIPLLGLLVMYIPDVYVSIINFKESREINIILFGYATALLIIFLTFIFDFFVH